MEKVGGGFRGLKAKLNQQKTCMDQRQNVQRMTFFIKNF